MGRVLGVSTRIQKIIKDAIIIHCSVPIPQEDYPEIKFEEVLNHQVLERVEKETGIKVMISGRGSREYGKYGGHQHHSDMPLQVCITSDRSEQVKKAYDEILEIIKVAISRHCLVPIPQEAYPTIKFEEVLNHKVLERVEKETRIRLLIGGRGASSYGRYGMEEDRPLHAIVYRYHEHAPAAKDMLKEIIKDAIDNW